MTDPTPAAIGLCRLFRERLYELPGGTSPWLGTFVGGDGYVGRVTSSTFTLAGDHLHIPVAGYPISAGNSLDPHSDGGSWRSLRIGSLHRAQSARRRGSDGTCPSPPGKAGRQDWCSWMRQQNREAGWRSACLPSIMSAAPLAGRGPTPVIGGFTSWPPLRWPLCFFCRGSPLLTWFPNSWPPGVAFVAVPGLLAPSHWGLGNLDRPGAQSMSLSRPRFSPGTAAVLALLCSPRTGRGGPALEHDGPTMS